MKHIQGYEKLYGITKEGKVWVYPKIWRCRNNYIIFRKGKYLSPDKTKKGYLRVNLTKNNFLKWFSVHRLVAEAFIENPLNLPQVNHKNGIKNDNRVENLEWITQSENTIHSFKTGLQKGLKGEKHPRSKFTNIKINSIRKLYKSGKYSQRELAKCFNTSQAEIWYIINKGWSHI